MKLLNWISSWLKLQLHFRCSLPTLDKFQHLLSKAWVRSLKIKKILQIFWQIFDFTRRKRNQIKNHCNNRKKWQFCWAPALRKYEITVSGIIRGISRFFRAIPNISIFRRIFFWFQTQSVTMIWWQIAKTTIFFVRTLVAAAKSQKKKFQTGPSFTLIFFSFLALCRFPPAFTLLRPEPFLSWLRFYSLTPLHVSLVPKLKFLRISTSDESNPCGASFAISVKPMPNKMRQKMTPATDHKVSLRRPIFSTRYIPKKVQTKLKPEVTEVNHSATVTDRMPPIFTIEVL